MTPPNCHGCQNHRLKYVIAWAEHRDRCVRPQTIITHDGPKITPVSDMGTDCSFETDNCPEPQRVSGDKCGPERRHFQPGSVM